MSMSGVPTATAAASITRSSGLGRSLASSKCGLINVELLWKRQHVRDVMQRLWSFCRVIYFDKRGTGVSVRVPMDRLPSLEHGWTMSVP